MNSFTWFLIKEYLRRIGNYIWAIFLLFIKLHPYYDMQSSYPHEWGEIYEAQNGSDYKIIYIGNNQYVPINSPEQDGTEA